MSLLSGFKKWIREGDKKYASNVKKEGQYVISEVNGLSLKDIGRAKTKKEALENLKKIALANPNKKYMTYDELNPSKFDVRIYRGDLTDYKTKLKSVS